MIKLSRIADYAFVVLSELSQTDQACMAASDLARKTALPEPTVAKILKALTRAGLLMSTRGVNGGYRLTRPAEKISVATVITAIDGPIAITDCVDDHGCAMGGYCGMHKRWGKVNTALRTALEGVTLNDIREGA